MDINAVCEKAGQAKILSGIHGITRVFHSGNTMPYVFRNKDAASCESFLSEPYLLVRNIDEIGYLKEKGYKGDIYADHTVYTFNRASRELLTRLGVKGDTAPLELTLKELEARGMTGSELMIYGRIPMMISAGCLYKNSHNDKCDKDKANGHELILTDRMFAGFPVICDCRYCYNIILNSVPLSLHAETGKIRGICAESLRLYFTVEEPKEVLEIASYFISLYNDDPSGKEIPAPPYEAYTRGHARKGVG
ncbi:MAG: hypothetical protein K6G42_10060 [Lachnospiraceae bacterium]|nr:hypothetical protein [Lachnospiraceae bacterium]